MHTIIHEHTVDIHIQYLIGTNPSIKKIIPVIKALSDHLESVWKSCLIKGKALYISKVINIYKMPNKII